MIKLQKIMSGEIGFIKFCRFFLASFLFCVPFQIRTYIYGGSFFLNGNFNPYTTFFIYLTDVFLILAFLCWGIAMMRGERTQKIEAGHPVVTAGVIMFLIFCLAGVFLSPDKNLAFFLSLRPAVFFLLYLMLINEILDRDEIIKYLIAGILLQAVIGIGQYVMQRALGLSFLGETAISTQAQGVAKIDWDGMKILRSYGTFSHANVFGGALFMALILSFYKFADKMKYLLPLLAVLIMALIFTFSRSAFFALVAALLLYMAVNEGKISLKYTILGFSLIVFFIVSFNLEGIFFQRFMFGGDVESGMERMQYFDISKRMLADNPLGVGMGGFTLYMQDYSVEKLEPWFFQPVHNVFLLAANELGLIGGACLILFIGAIFYLLVKNVMDKKIGQNEKGFGYAMIALLGGIITISLFDHYFFSIYQGQALFFICLALASIFLKKFPFPSRKS